MYSSAQLCELCEPLRCKLPVVYKQLQCHWLYLHFRPGLVRLIIKDVGMDITTNKLNWRHRYTTPWRIHHTILLLSWQTTKPYGYFCTFKTDIAIPLPRLLITACNAKPILFIPVTDVTIRLPVLSMTSYNNCTQFALIGNTLTDISSLIHVWPSW